MKKPLPPLTKLFGTLRLSLDIANPFLNRCNRIRTFISNPWKFTKTPLLLELIELITIPYNFSSEELKKAGWKEDEATKSLREDILYKVPFQYESKYFSLTIPYI